MIIISKSCADGQKTSKINNNIVGCIDCLNNEYLQNIGDQIYEALRCSME